MKEQDFNIEGTINTSKWKTRSSWNRNFQEELEFFKASLIEQVKNQESKIFSG